MCTRNMAILGSQICYFRSYLPRSFPGPHSTDSGTALFCCGMLCCSLNLSCDVIGAPSSSSFDLPLVFPQHGTATNWHVAPSRARLFVPCQVFQSLLHCIPRSDSKYRLQVLTPLSLLINVATVAVCSTVVNPSIGTYLQSPQECYFTVSPGGVSKLWPTSISPKPALIAVYVAVIYVGQIGYCLLLVLAKKPETKVSLLLPSPPLLWQPVEHSNQRCRPRACLC